MPADAIPITLGAGASGTAGLGLHSGGRTTLQYTRLLGALVISG